MLLSAQENGGGPPLTGTNNGGGVALEDQDVEADGEGCGD
jgi:hypothetical protein